MSEDEEVIEGGGEILTDITETQEENFEPKKVPGVIFISSIPKGMGPIHVRQFMVKFGELGRIYLGTGSSFVAFHKELLKSFDQSMNFW